MAVKLGHAARIYRGAAPRATWGEAVDGTHVGSAASLTEITTAKDVELSVDKEQADATTRGMRGWKATKGTLKDASLDVPLEYDPADPGYLALMKACMTDATIPLAVLDGDKATAGVEGLWADFEVVGVKKGEPLNGTQLITFTVKPGLSAVPPEWVRVGGGA